MLKYGLNSSGDLGGRKATTNADVKSFDVLRQLRRAAIIERKLNLKLMHIKSGKSVAFGDPVQLRHVKSGKFLTISSNVLAEQERENMRITAEPEGSSLSYLNFMPRFKYAREGQAVVDKVEALLGVHEKPGEFIHASVKTLVIEQEMQMQRFEVNCSLEQSPWVVAVYHHHEHLEHHVVMANQLVTLQVCTGI